MNILPPLNGKNGLSGKGASASTPVPLPSGWRVPPRDCEIFIGDYVHWTTFRDLFSAMYVQNPRLRGVEKLFQRGKVYCCIITVDLQRADSFQKQATARQEPAKDPV